MNCSNKRPPRLKGASKDPQRGMNLATAVLTDPRGVRVVVVVAAAGGGVVVVPVAVFKCGRTSVMRAVPIRNTPF